MVKNAKKTQRMPLPVKMAEERFVLSKNYRKVAYALNKAYDETTNAKITSNTIRQFENTLETFYEKYGLRVKNPHHISMQKEMTKAQAEELASITMAFADKAVEEHNFVLSDIMQRFNPKDRQRLMDWQQMNIIDGVEAEYDVDVDNLDDMAALEVDWETFDYEKFEYIQDKYGVEDIQQFIDWTDQMERYRNNAFLSEILSSDQIADLFAYRQQGKTSISEKQFVDKIRYQYNKYGYTGEELHAKVQSMISKQKNRLEKKQKSRMRK